MIIAYCIPCAAGKAEYHRELEALDEETICCRKSRQPLRIVVKIAAKLGSRRPDDRCGALLPGNDR